MQVSSVSAMHLPETPTPGWPGLAAAILLPIVEADSISPNAAWLTELARHVLMLVERMVPVKMLPVLTAGCFPTMPLTIWPTQPLLIIPWGITSTQNPRTTGEALLRSLRLDERLGAFRFVPFRPPRPTLTALASLNALGGWAGESHAELARLVAVCPGWDEEITLKGPVCVLRDPLRILPAAADPPQSAAHLLLLRAAHSGQTLDPLATMDVQLVVRYLAHVLVATIQAVKMVQDYSREVYLL